MLVVATIALGLGGYLWAFRPPMIVVEPAPPPRSASPDHEIFDVVLLDLIADPEFHTATGAGGVKASRIVMGDTTAGWISPEVLESDSYSTKRTIPPDIRDDLMRRNPRHRRYVLAQYHPSSPNILMRDLRRVEQDLGFSAQFPDARGYVNPQLPGYSRDGLTACFRFGFGPTVHGAVGLYLLKKVNGRWEIVWKYFGYYV
jgi:hypothetical protein